MDCLLNDVAVKIPDTILDDDNAFEEFFSEAQVSKKDRTSILGICRRFKKLAMAGNMAPDGAPVDWGVSVLFAVLKYRRNNTHVVYLYFRASAAAPNRSLDSVALWADTRSFTAASYASCHEFVVVQSHEDAQRYSKIIRSMSNSDEDFISWGLPAKAIQEKKNCTKEGKCAMTQWKRKSRQQSPMYQTSCQRC